MSGEGLIAEPRAVHQSVGHARLKELMHRGTEFLGCDVAIMGGAMSWVSERNLVSAISNAGGFGVIACGAMTPELLDTEIAETKARTQRPFGVNLITMHPQLSELIDTCVKHEVGHVVLAGGLPPGWAIEKIKSHGAKLMAFAPALSAREEADALERRRAGHRGHGGRRPHRAGRDLGAGAGNPAARLPRHARCSSPAASAAARRSPPISKWARSGSSSARASSARTKASPTPTSRRRSSAPRPATPSPRSRSTRACRSFPVRALKNREMENFAAKQREVAELLDEGAIEMAEAQLQIEHYWAGALRRAVIDGDVETGSVMAGQSVGMVNREEPVADIIRELVDEAAAALESRG